jgi:uncharacterized protein YbbC (DUF1343 family)
MKKYILLFMLFAFLTPAQVLKTGADLLLSENSDLLKGKNIGLVTNHTGFIIRRTTSGRCPCKT